MSEIRAYRETDQQQVIELWQACGLLRPWNNPTLDILRKQSVGADLFLVATKQQPEKQQITAAVMGGYDGHRGWMNYLAVSPEQRGTGLGRRIVLALESRLLQLGCPKLNLQVRSDNESVIGFYGSLGYIQDDVVSFGKRLIADDPPDSDK